MIKIDNKSIQIISNGSKWAGQEPDTIEKLLTVLENNPLDDMFEKYGNFVMFDSIQYKSTGKKTWVFFGNFLTVSHVFNIKISDEQLAIMLARAIRKNQSKENYKNQKNINRYFGGQHELKN